MKRLALQEVEGWKWAQVHLDYPHSHGLRRTYPQPVELSVEDQAALDAVQAEFDSLTEQHESARNCPMMSMRVSASLKLRSSGLKQSVRLYNPAMTSRDAGPS